MYNTIEPDNKLKQYIENYWIYKNYKSDYLLTLNPDGCFDILVYFYSENKVYITGMCDKTIKVNLKKDIDIFGIRLFPNALEQFFNVSVAYIKNKKIDFTKEMLKYNVDCSIIFETKEVDKVRLFFEQYFLYSLRFDTNNLVSDFLQSIDFSVKIEELSKNIGISSRHLTRVLKGQFGINTKTYISISRFIKAKKLLECDLDYDSIIDECGYYDQSHFIREFKKYTGKSPSEFK